MSHSMEFAGWCDHRSARRAVLGGITALLFLGLTATPAVGQEDSVAVAAAH
jgi:hypothetical protein